MSISNSAVLVSLSISAWTARKLDKRKTEEVNIAANASKGASKLYKDLMVGTQLVEQANKYAAQCRLANTQWTMPWDNEGERCLPSSLTLDYKTEFNKRRDVFFGYRDKIVESLPMMKLIARDNLGDMYNPEDYPDPDTVWEKYDWKIRFKPVPESGHLYLDIPAQELEEMKASIDASTSDAAKATAKHNWETLYKMLSAMSAKLKQANDDTATKKTRFHDVFVDDAVDLCRMLTHFNITGDPELERARKMLEDTMFGADIEIIKESPMVRERMQTKVDNILNQFDW